jgi:hypothetical protein
MNGGLERRRGAKGLNSHLTSPYTTENSGAVSLDNCTVCLGQFYWDGFKCDPCPSGVYCDDPWEAQTLTNLVTRPGWFRFTPTSKKVYQCPYDTCLGGNITHASFMKVTYTKEDGYGKNYHSRDTSQCHPGSEGPLCAICSKGNKIDKGTRLCEECTVSGVQQAGILVFICFVAAILLVSIFKRVRDIVVWEAHTVEMVMIVVTTIQTIQLLTDNFERSGGESPPGWYLTFLSFCAVFSFDLSIIVQLECFSGSVGDYYVNLVISSLMLLVALMYFAFRYACADDTERGVVFLGRFILLAKFTLPPISRTVIKAYTCGAFDAGDFMYMTMDYSVDCKSNHYKYFIHVYSGFMVAIFPCGIPLVVFILLYRISRSLIHIEALQNSGVYDSTGDFVPDATMSGTKERRSRRRNAGVIALEEEEEEDDDDDDDDDADDAEQDSKDAGASLDKDVAHRKEGFPRDTGRKHPGEPRAHIKRHKALRESPLYVLFQFLKPEFWWFEIVDLARRLLITCATLTFASSPKTFSESHKFHGSMASSSKLLFFALSVASLSVFMQREANVYISWSLNLLKCMEHGQLFMVAMVLLARESGLFGFRHPTIPYYYGGLFLLVGLFAMMCVITYTLLPSLRIVRLDLNHLGQLVFEETSELLHQVRRDLFHDLAAEQPARRAFKTRGRRKRNKEAQPEGVGDGHPIVGSDDAATSEEYAQTNPLYAKTETQRLRRVARKDRAKNRKAAEAREGARRAHPMDTSKQRTDTEGEMENAPGEREEGRRSIATSIFWWRSRAAASTDDEQSGGDEGRQPMGGDLVNAMRAMHSAGLTADMIAVTLRVELRGVREVLGLGEQDELPGFQTESKEGIAALQDKDKLSRSRQRDEIRSRQAGNRRKNARLKITSARSPLYADELTSGESDGENVHSIEGDINLGGIENLYLEAAVSDVEYMDASSIVFTSAVNYEDVDEEEAKDVQPDEGSRRSLGSAPSRRSRDAAMSGRRDRKKLKERAIKEANSAAKFRSASKRAKPLLLDTENDVIVPLISDPEDIILTQHDRATGTESYGTDELDGEQSNDSDVRSSGSTSTAASRSRRTDTSRERAERRIKTANERREKRRRRKLQKEVVLPAEPSLQVDRTTSPPELQRQDELQKEVYHEAAAVGAEEDDATSVRSDTSKRRRRGQGDESRPTERTHSRDRKKGKRRRDLQHINRLRMAKESPKALARIATDKLDAGEAGLASVVEVIKPKKSGASKVAPDPDRTDSEEIAEVEEGEDPPTKESRSRGRLEARLGERARGATRSGSRSSRRRNASARREESSRRRHSQTTAALPRAEDLFDGELEELARGGSSVKSDGSPAPNGFGLGTVFGLSSSSRSGSTANGGSFSAATNPLRSFNFLEADIYDSDNGISGLVPRAGSRWASRSRQERRGADTREYRGHREATRERRRARGERRKQRAEMDSD